MFRGPILRVSSFHRLAGRLSRRPDCQRAPPLPLISSKKLYSSTPESDKKGYGKYYVLLGSAIAVYAYQAGYMDQYFGRKQPFRTENSSVDANIKEEMNLSSTSETLSKGPIVDNEIKHVSPEDSTVFKKEPIEDRPQAINEVTENLSNDDLPLVSDEETKETQKLPTEDSTETIDPHKVETKQNLVSQLENPEDGTELSKGPESFAEPETLNPEMEDVSDLADSKMATDNSTSIPEDTSDLFNAYLLKEDPEESSQANPNANSDDPLTNKKNDATSDGKLVVDLLEAIHEAESRQAQLDAAVFAEEKRFLKNKYEKELRDLRARELMRAEEVALLEKEIRREETKAAAAIRALEEEMEANLLLQLEQKDNEADEKVKNAKELARADKIAAIGREKAAQIKEMTETNFNIDALCMAFYARSEESRQIHSVHKLAVGTLAVDDALNRGLPLGHELDSLRASLGHLDETSLLHRVVSTLPSDARTHGTDTLAQLIQKLEAMKGRLRSAALVPPGGGGVYAYTLAYAASWLRIRNVGASGSGIESTLCKVEGFLAEGKIAEAAHALEEGVKGTEAEALARDWVARARTRAIAEQALTVLTSYATALSLAH